MTRLELSGVDQVVGGYGIGWYKAARLDNLAPFSDRLVNGLIHGLLYILVKPLYKILWQVTGPLTPCFSASSSPGTGYSTLVESWVMAGNGLKHK